MAEELEIWKDIDGYELYQVSTLGRVRKTSNQKILKCPINTNGYHSIRLSAYNKNFLVHRLMMFAFVPNPNNYPHVNHINGIKSDNSLNNLEWCTVRQNRLHALATGLSVGIKGVRPYSKLDESQVLCIRKCLSNKFPSKQAQKELARYFNVSQTLMSAIKRRVAWFNLHEG